MADEKEDSKKKEAADALVDLAFAEGLYILVFFDPQKIVEAVDDMRLGRDLKRGIEEQFDFKRAGLLQ